MKLEAARRLALSLPEAVEAPHHEAQSFRVRGRIFATVPPDQTQLHVFVPEPQRDLALALHPEGLEPLRWGGKVVGLRVALQPVAASVVGPLLRAAWAHRAPASLRAALGQNRR
jgi:hypothetical protein